MAIWWSFCDLLDISASSSRILKLLGRAYAICTVMPRSSAPHFQALACSGRLAWTLGSLIRFLASPVRTHLACGKPGTVPGII